MFDFMVDTPQNRQSIMNFYNSMIFHEIVKLPVKNILYAGKPLYQHLNQVVLTIDKLCEFTTRSHNFKRLF